MKKSDCIKRAVRGLAVLTAALLISSCKVKKIDLKQRAFIDEERSGTEIILGFSQIGSESSWRTCNTQSILDAAAKEGIQVIYDNAQQKQENQLKAIRSFIVYRVDVIAFVPIVETGWDNVLQEAKDAHIPVIVVDRKIRLKNDSLYDGYIGENAYEEGQRAAQFLLSKYKDSDARYRILEVTGTENSSVAKERSAGFRDEIRTDRKFSIANAVCGDFLKSRGKECIVSLIDESKRLPYDIIYSHNDAMTLGILEGLAENGIRSGTDLVIVSVDAEQKSIDALKAGRINCVVECNPRIGPELMKLVKVAANRNLIPRETYIPESLFSETCNFDAITPRGY